MKNRYQCAECGRVESAHIVPVGWTLFDKQLFCDGHLLTLTVTTPPGPPIAPRATGKVIEFPSLPFRKAA